jgi:hypothetical protein
MSYYKKNIALVNEWWYIKRKLRSGEPLTLPDKLKIIALMDMAEDTLIPSQRQINSYRNHYLQFMYTDKACVSAAEEHHKAITRFEKKFVLPLRKAKTHY